MEQLNIHIEPLQKKDFGRAQQYTIDCMHLNNLVDSYFVKFFSAHYWYMEVAKATLALGAYYKEKLVGVMLVEEYGKPKLFSHWLLTPLLYLMTLVVSYFYQKANIYYETNELFEKEFKKMNDADGEILYFAVDPVFNGNGIGSLLLKEVEKRNQGKSFYLFTDTECTYQFYEKRGFLRQCKRDITMKANGKDVQLTCFLYNKTFD